MFVTGFSLATLTLGGFYMIYQKLPRRVRKFMEKHALLTDLTACLLTYILFGGTIVALFAAAWMGILISILLAIVANPKLNGMLQHFNTFLKQIKDSVISFGETFANKYYPNKEMVSPETSITLESN